MLRQDQIRGTPFITQVPVSEVTVGTWVEHEGVFKTLANKTISEDGTNVIFYFDHGDYQITASYSIDSYVVTRQ